MKGNAETEHHCTEHVTIVHGEAQLGARHYGPTAQYQCAVCGKNVSAERLFKSSRDTLVRVHRRAK